MSKALILSIAIVLVACQGGDGKAGGAGSAAPAGGATTSLTKAQLDEVYKAADPDKYDASVKVGSSRVDLQACKLEYSIVSPK